MAAPVLVGTGTTASGAAAGSIAWPSGHASGDLGILFVETDSGDATLSISGWSHISGSPLTVADASLGVGQDSKFNVLIKTAASSSEAAATWSDPGDHWVAGMIVVRGVDTSSPFAFGPTWQEYTNSSTSVTLPSFTSSGADNLVVLGVSCTDDAAAALTSSNLVDAGAGSSQISIAAADGNDGSVFVHTGVIAISGTTKSSAGYSISNRGGSSRIGDGAVVFGLKPVPVSAIAGTTSSVLSTTATIVGTGALASSITNVLTGVGTLSGAGSILGNTSSVLSINSTLAGSGALIGSSAAVLTVTGTGAALTDSLLSANINLTSSAQGTLHGVADLVSTVSNILNTSATLKGAGALNASAPSVLTTSAVINAIYGIQGTSVNTLTASGTLSGSYTLGGNSFNILTTTATLRGLGSLAGTSISVLTTVANGSATSPIRGTSSSVLTTLSTLRSIPNPSISSNWRNLWLAVYNTRQILLNKIMGLTKVTLDSQSTAITSLQSAITHPTTGLAAQASAISTLQTRVTATENAITSQSSSITALTSSLADKASASAVSSLITRVTTLESEFNINLLLNPSLSSNDNFWDVNRYASGGILVDQFLADRDYGAVSKPAGKHILYMQTLGTFPMGARGISYLERLRCLPSTDYIYSGWGAQDRLGCGELRIFFFDASGAYINESGVYIATTGIVYTGGTDLANWKRVYQKVTSPSNAAYVQVAPNLWSDGGAGANARWFDLMLERAAPGQTTPSAFNRGSAAAWAEWSLKFDVNGYISGMNFTSDGNVSNFIINADKFQVLKPGGGPSLTWSNGKLWNKGTDYSVILGQDMSPDEDVLLWIGPNPASPEAALKEDAAFFVDESGNAFFRGTVHQSLISGSAFELGSTRIHTGGGRLAPFTVRAAAYKGTGSRFSGAVTLTDFQSPDVGTGYHYKRVTRKRTDVSLNCFFQGDGNSGDKENLYLEVQYDGGAWTTITSKTNIDTDNHGSWVFLIRYTTLDSWNTVAFRARTTGGYSMILSLALEIDNTYETGNDAGSWSGTDASTGMGGATPPPPDPGGGGGGGVFCLVADMTYLPDGTMLKDSSLGTKILCWDGNLETPGTKYQTLRKMPMGQEECFLVTTANGAQVPQSVSTPTLVQDGRMVRTPNLLGEVVLTNLQGDLLWSEVISMEALGIRDVVKPDLADHVFFAGLDPAATIATHNLRDKGVEP